MKNKNKNGYNGKVNGENTDFAHLKEAILKCVPVSYSLSFAFYSLVLVFLFWLLQEA